MLGGLAVAQHDDNNRGADGAHTVCDHYDRLILDKPRQCRPDGALVLYVKAHGRFVKQDFRRVPEEIARYLNALTRAALVFAVPAALSGSCVGSTPALILNQNTDRP